MHKKCKNHQLLHEFYASLYKLFFRLMKFSFEIRELLKSKSGRDLTTPADCEYIALDIYSVTNEHIGVNTLKRLLGFLEEDRDARVSTLNIIAQYLGYSNWETLSNADVCNSTFDNSTEDLNVETLSMGQQVEITYLPNRKLILEYQGCFKFVVKDSVNSKLHTDDIIEVRHILLNYPLVASNVVRKGENLGQLKAGIISGLKSIKLL